MSGGRDREAALEQRVAGLEASLAEANAAIAHLTSLVAGSGRSEREARPSVIDVLGVDACTLILQHAMLEHPVSTAMALRSTCRLFRTASAAASRAALGMQAARLHDLRLRVYLQCDDNVPAVLVSKQCEAALRSGDAVADSPLMRRHQQVALPAQRVFPRRDPSREAS